LEIVIIQQVFIYTYLFIYFYTYIIYSTGFHSYTTTLYSVLFDSLMARKEGS